MIRKIGSLQMILALLATLSFCSLLLVLQPAWIPILDLSTDEASNIGGAIGGITAPVVGMFSAYLLYEALTAQLGATKVQSIKNDVDIILMLLNQLDDEYKSFSTKFIHNSGKSDERSEVTYGYKGLLDFANIYSNLYDNSPDANNDEFYNNFLFDYQVDEFLLLIRSFALIREHLEQVNADDNTLKIINKKLDIYYKTKFESAVKILVTSFTGIDHPLAVEILTFRNKNFKD